MPHPTLLLYDPLGEWAEHLKPVCAVQGVRYRAVSDPELSLPLSALAEGSKGTAPAAPLPEPVFVFCSLTDGKLNRMLAALRRLGVPPRALKAVLTASNSQWPFTQLYTQLCAERLRLPPAGEGAAL